ncbi:MAG: hypothetical protein RL219_1113, partial [Actinomycetota bacterium]
MWRLRLSHDAEHGHAKHGDGKHGDHGTTSMPMSAAEELAHRAEDLTASKAMMPAFQLTMLSVLGGIFISFAAIVSTAVTAGGGMAPGVSRFLG